MSTPYFHANGRMEHRAGGGQFRRSTLGDLGISETETNRAGQRQCANCPCVWEPILVRGQCPECGGTDSAPLPLAKDAPRTLQVAAAFTDPMWFRAVRHGCHPATVEADGAITLEGERLAFKAGEKLAPGTRVEVWLERDFMARAHGSDSSQIP